MLTNYEKKYHGDAQKFGRVVVLCGGNSQEREVSLLSGEAIYQALLAGDVNVTKVDVGHDLVSRLVNKQFDRVFIALHGVGGEDGKVQALLELLDIPFTGSAHAPSAMAMNKLKSKQIWQSVIIYIKNDAKIFLSMAMAAVGLSTNLKDLKSMGYKPFIVGLIAMVTVGLVSIVAMKILFSI